MEQRKEGDTALPPQTGSPVGHQMLSPPLTYLLVVLSQLHATPLPPSFLPSSNFRFQLRPDRCGGDPGEGWVTNASRPLPARAGEDIGTFFPDKQQ